MANRLGDDDRKAIDLIMDRANTVSEVGYAAPSPAVTQARLRAVQRVLSLLEQMPAMDPPEGLADRTVNQVLQHADSPTVSEELAQRQLQERLMGDPRQSA